MFSIKFGLQRSIIINKPIEDVFRTVSDFHTWKSWSPWLCQEPDCPVEVSGSPGEVGHEQAWEGKRIGSGNMKIIQKVTNQQLDYDLFFLTPWKSHSKVSFIFSTVSEGTKVQWTMEGTLPFFLFFMKKMMSALVGSDYQRGLGMLKDLTETGEVLSRVEINDIISSEGFSFIGVKEACSIDEIGPSMASVFSKLQKKVDSGVLPNPDFSLSFYNQFNMTKNHCVYTSGFGYTKPPSILQTDEYIQGKIPKHKALKVDHFGLYRHLGNAWSTIMGCQRSDKLQVRKQIPMYEVYESMPGEVAEKEIKTSIYLPLK